MSRHSKPSIHVTAGLIRKNNRFLITKRPKGSHLEDYWEFPGGKQEQGESLKACLEREILEELGLRISANHPVVTTVYEYETKIVTLHVFECAILEGEPRAIECQEFKWVDFQNLEELKFPPPDIKILEILSPKGIGFSWQ